MSTDPSSSEKKILIDEDWKSQVEAERENARQTDAPNAAGPSPKTEKPTDQQLPPPTLTFLAGTLYLQGAVSLGLLPHPSNDKPQVHLDLARHAIELLSMLEQKTEGNRTPEESEELTEMLHQLRMAYVAVAGK